MDRRHEMIIFFTVLGVLAVLALWAYSHPVSVNDNIFDSITVGGKADSLDNYIQEVRDRQTETQRDNTIKLYISMLDQGNFNRKYAPTGFSESDRVKVCAKANELATSATKLEQAKQIADFLGKEMEYDWGNVVIDATGKPRQAAKKDPLEVLDAGVGLCGELTNTYMVMTECIGVDSYFVYGGGHAWNAINLDGVIYEVDTTQDCFDCDVSQPEHSYPLYGLCDFDSCITITQIASLAMAQESIFDQAIKR